MIRLHINFAKYRPIRGSSFIALPFELSTCQAVLNIQNHNDKNCFVYCYIAAVFRCLKENIGIKVDGQNDTLRATNPKTYKDLKSIFSAGNFLMPMGLRSLNMFEKLNSVQINVFGYHKKDLYPIQISTKKSSEELVIDLLLLYYSDKHHYVLIRDLCKFYCFLRSMRYRSYPILSRNCFLLCYDGVTAFNEHVERCKDHSPALVRMPSENSNIYKFNNCSALCPPVTTSSLSGNVSSSSTIEILEPSGFALTVVEHNNPKPKYTQLDSSENCMEIFVKVLHKLANDIHKQKQKHPCFRGDRSKLARTESVACWICKDDFDENDEKDYSGEFLGWAHPQCNRLRRTSKFIPVIGHNIQIYDLHHICLALQECEPSTRISVIPATDEKYVSMQLGVQVDTMKRDGQTVPVYEFLRYVDSYKFFNASLEKLTETLPQSEFGILEIMFNETPSDYFDLLKQKGYYPYSYMSNRTKFSEDSLPPIEAWKNSLNGTTNKQNEWNHANRMWNLLGCKSMQDYHDAYLKLDCALLACCSEYCRKISFKTYKLDVVQFFTAPNVAKDAPLRITKAEVQLFTEREHLDMVEPAIRGCVTTVFESRHFKANNRYLPGFNSKETSTFGLMVDANNLYGGVMQEEMLPVGDFCFVFNISITTTPP